MTSIYAAGGTITKSGNTYFHKYTVPGTFLATQAITINYILVGGGDPGGDGNGNGTAGSGGNGGKIYTDTTSLAVNGIIYDMVIGSGGSSAA